VSCHGTWSPVCVMLFAVIVTANTASHLSLPALAITGNAFCYLGHAHALSYNYIDDNYKGHAYSVLIVGNV